MLPYNKIDAKLILKIIERYKELGYGSYDLIQKELLVSKRAIARILKEAKINTKRKNNYTLNESFFSIIDNENKAYLLGMMYADGFNGGINHISIGLKSEEHLKKIANLLEFTGDIKDRISGFGKKQKLLSFSSKQMSSDLIKYGVVVGKAKDMYTLPDISESLINHFIRGYFDGDGSVYSSKSSTKNKYGKRYYYIRHNVEIIGCRKILDVIANKLKEIGITSSTKQSKTSYMEYIRISGGRNLRLLRDYFYSNATIYLQYKYEILAQDKLR